MRDPQDARTAMLQDKIMVQRKFADHWKKMLRRDDNRAAAGRRADDGLRRKILKKIDAAMRANAAECTNTPWQAGNVHAHIDAGFQNFLK